MKRLHNFFSFYTFKNLIISYTFILFDISFILFQLNFPCDNAFINCNNASYILHLYGFIFIQILYIIIKYMNKFNLYTLIRQVTLQKLYLELYETILTIIFTFIVLYNVTLFVGLTIFQRKMIISDIPFLVNTIILQILFYSVFAQLYIWIYLISFKSKITLFTIMTCYYVVAFLVSGFEYYFLICSTFNNKQYFYNLIYANIILSILIFLYKRRDVNIEA